MKHIYTEMDTLFYKVIHNKFLFRKIFNCIESVKWVSYDNIDGYNALNRKKFKDITSLEWMIDNGQHELLKCKLENGEVNIGSENDKTFNGLTKLFKKQKLLNQFKGTEDRDEYLANHFVNVGYYSTGDHIKVFEKNKLHDDNIVGEIQKVKETITLLKKYKREQLVQIDLLATIFKNSREFQNSIDPDLIEVAISDPNPIPITEASLENAIKFSTTSILKVLIDSPNCQISNHVKNRSISMAFNNKDGEKMMEFILDNRQLYNIPPTTTPPSNKKFKSEDGSPYLVRSVDILNDGRLESELKEKRQEYDEHGKCKKDKDTGIVKIRYMYAFYIKSKSIINKLYELNYLIDNMGSFIPDQTLSKELQVQSIFKNYSDKMFLSDAYLKLYDGTMGYDGFSVRELYIHAIYERSAMTLKHLLDIGFKKSDLDGKRGRIQSEDCKRPNSKMLISYESIAREFPFTKEFIQNYSIGYAEFDKNPDIIEDIKRYMLSIRSNQEYQDHFNLITKECNENQLNLPSKWFDISKLKIRSHSIVIEDTETVDLIADNFEYINSYYSYFDEILSSLPEKGRFGYQTLQLIEYAKKNHSTVLETSSAPKYKIYEYPFTFAIANCNVESLKELVELKLKFGNQKGFNEFSEIDPTSLNGLIQWDKMTPLEMVPFNFKNQSESSLCKLLEYLNSTGYKYFSPNLFTSLVECIGCSVSSFNLSNLKINFHQFKIDLPISLLLSSIGNTISSNIIQLVLNNYGEILFSDKNESALLKTWKLLDKSKDNNTLVYCKLSDPHSLFSEHEHRYFDNSTLFFPIYEFGEKTEENPFGGNTETVKTLHYCTSKDPIKDIRQSIDCLLSYCTNNKDKLSVSSIGLLESLINYLFKRYLRACGGSDIQFKQISEQYQTISNSWLLATQTSFTFQHSIFQIFYYLGNKSLKLVKFLLQFPSIYSFFNEVTIEDGELSYNNNIFQFEKDDFFNPTNQVDGFIDIARFIDPKIFTFQFISDSTFQTILEKLINDTIYKHATIYQQSAKKSLYNDTLSSMLVYLLEIREFDLFFNHLETIKQKHPEFTGSFELTGCSKIVLNIDQLSKFNEIIQS